MKKALNIIICLTLLYFTFTLITPYSSFLRTRSIENQITYIHKRLELGDDNVLQRRYPEGKIFSNAIFALSAIQYFDDSNKEKAAIIIDKCIKRLLSERSKRTFDDSLNPKFGAFYNGWINIVLKTYKQSSIYPQSGIQDLVESNYHQLSNRIIDSVADSLTYMETYSGGIWPADNLVCIASLSDELDSFKIEWVNTLLYKTETSSGLFYHVNSKKEEIRGSSQALSLYFLHQIHPTLAKRENEVFKKLLINKVMGIQFVHEHLQPSTKGMDIDSGPVLFTYGSVATIMNTKTQAAFRQDSKLTWGFLNMLGLPISTFRYKYYLFKQELMFDIFMLWCSVEINDY